MLHARFGRAALMAALVLTVCCVCDGWSQPEKKAGGGGGRSAGHKAPSAPKAGNQGPAMSRPQPSPSTPKASVPSTGKKTPGASGKPASGFHRPDAGGGDKKGAPGTAGKRPKPGGGSESGAMNDFLGKDASARPGPGAKDRPSTVKDKDGRPTIGKDKDGRPTVGKEKDKDGRPTVGKEKDKDGRPTVGKEKDGRPTIGKEKDGRPTVGKEKDGRPTVGKDKDKDGRPLIGKEKEKDDRPLVDKDKDGRPTIGKEKDGRPAIDKDKDKDKDGRPIVDKGKDKDGRPIAGKDRDKDGRPIVVKDKDKDGRPIVGKGGTDINKGGTDINVGDVTIDKSVDYSKNQKAWVDNRKQTSNQVRANAGDRYATSYRSGDYRRGATGGYPYNRSWGTRGNYHGWKPASYAGVGAFMGASWAKATPTYYAYGQGGNVYYEDNTAYVDGRAVGTAEEFAKQALALAAAAPAPEKMKETEWMPLGVFAFAREGVADTQAMIELAISKDGVLAGTYYNETSEVSRPIRGRIDPKSQRLAIGFADGKNTDLALETGIYNLTQEEAPALLHMGTGESTAVLLVRLEAPEE